MPAGPEHVINRRGEIIQPCARDDDGVPPTVSFLGDAQEFSALVLAEFEVKPLPFDLNFFRFENAVHFEHLSGAYRVHRKDWKQILFGLPARKLFGGSGF